MAGEWETAPLDELVDEVLDRRNMTPLKLGSDFVSTGFRVIFELLAQGAEACFVGVPLQRSPLLPVMPSTKPSASRSEG